MENVTIKTSSDVEDNCIFIASTEDDKDNYKLELNKAKSLLKGNHWDTIYECFDLFIQNNGDYYIINNCGVESLFVRKRIKKQISIPSLEMLLLTIGTEYSFTLCRFFNQAEITVTHIETNKEKKSVLPIDHHLNIDRINNCIEFSIQELKSTLL